MIYPSISSIFFLYAAILESTSPLPDTNKKKNSNPDEKTSSPQKEKTSSPNKERTPGHNKEKTPAPSVITDTRPMKKAKISDQKVNKLHQSKPVPSTSLNKKKAASPAKQNSVKKPDTTTSESGQDSSADKKLAEDEDESVDIDKLKAELSGMEPRPRRPSVVRAERDQRRASDNDQRRASVKELIRKGSFGYGNHEFQLNNKDIEFIKRRLSSDMKKPVLFQDKEVLKHTSNYRDKFYFILIWYKL